MGKAKTILNQTLMISTAVFFCLGVGAMIDYMTGGSPTFTWPWYMPFTIVLTSFLCSLPSLIVMSLETASGIKMWIMFILHFISVGLILTLAGFVFGWYDSLREYGVIMLMYAVIYVLVWLYTWWMYAREDHKINDRIKDFRDEE